MKCAIALVFAVVLTSVLGASVNKGISTHIAGGEEVSHISRPYAVRIDLLKIGENDYNATCGAVRLNQFWFVTAAECLDEEKYLYVRIVHTTGTPGFSPEAEFVLISAGVNIHPEYNNVTKANNIGLIHCSYCHRITDERAFPLLPKISENTELYSGLSAEVAGWTIHSTLNDFKNDNISTYTMAIVNPLVCKLTYFFRSVHDEHICVSSWGGKRVTKTDIGVPLIVEEETNEGPRVKLIGIASSVLPWTNWLPVPTVFTRIAPHVKWIEYETGIHIRP